MKDLDWSAGTVCEEEKVRNTTKKGRSRKQSNKLRAHSLVKKL